MCLSCSLLQLQRKRQNTNSELHKKEATHIFTVVTLKKSHLDRRSSSVGWSLDSPCVPAATASNEPPHSATEILHSEGPENTFVSATASPNSFF